MADVRQRKTATAATASADAGLGHSREDTRGRDKPKPPPAPLSRCAWLCCRFGGRTSKPCCGVCCGGGDCDGESPSCLEWTVWTLGIAAVAVSVSAVAFVLHLRGGYVWPKSAVLLANALWNIAMTLTGDKSKLRTGANAMARAELEAERRAGADVAVGTVVASGITQSVTIALLVFVLLACAVLPMMYLRRRCERKVPPPDADPTGPLDVGAAAADLSDDVEADALLRGFKGQSAHNHSH